MQCYCGKTFYQQNAFSNHQRYCKSSQNRLTSALSKAQQIWAAKREAQRVKRLGELEESQGLHASSSQLQVGTASGDSAVDLTTQHTISVDGHHEPSTGGPMVCTIPINLPP